MPDGMQQHNCMYMYGLSQPYQDILSIYTIRLLDIGRVCAVLQDESNVPSSDIGWLPIQ